VFLAYASKKGAAFVERSLYLPREWSEDVQRRAQAGVPQKIRFATKGELAKEMLRRAFEAQIPARWAVADTVYGTARGLRGWLEEQECSYVVAVPATKGVYHEGTQRRRHSRWLRSCLLRDGRGFQPVEEARRGKDSTIGPVWCYPRQPSTGSKRNSGR
jgi:SRSO17 transposase